MDVEDFARLPDGQVWETDICIVGSGPAGLTLARELSRGRLRVMLLESGGAVASQEEDALNEIESVGAAREMNQALLRNRVLGGTSATWSGRTAFFDEIDFETRDWVPHSGWPIPRDEIRSYLPRTMDHLGLGLADNTDVAAIWHSIRDRRYRINYDPKLLREYFWHYSKDERSPLAPMRFGARALREKAPNVRCLLHATVTHIVTNSDGGRVKAVEITHESGKRGVVKAMVTVLCAGGIENARLLLASRRIVRTGVGNALGVVGRFLMDHRRGAVGEFHETGDGILQDHFGIYRAAFDRGTFSLTYGAALSTHVQRRERLLNSAVWIAEIRAEDDPWSAIEAIIHRRGNTLRHFGNAAANARLLLAGLKRRFADDRGLPRKRASVNLQCIVEQAPDPDSRVTLADRVDRLGMPLSRIDWRIGEQESRTVRRAAELFSGELARLGITPPCLYDMARSDRDAPLSLLDVAHPIGTTRMSLDPRSGVVDTNGAVHGVSGLYVAGSSVFPTAGHANPTQMIVALSIRLADHLKAAFTAWQPWPPRGR